MTLREIKDEAAARRVSRCNSKSYFTRTSNE